MRGDEKFICLNCRNVSPLDTHLRCSSCGSDSVVSVERAATTAIEIDAEVERILKNSNM